MPNDETPPNGDPQEVAGPKDSQVSTNACELKPKEMLDADEAVDFSMRDELAEQFPLETIAIGIDPDDGMPTPMDTVSENALAPKFGPDTVVCIEDESEFVEVFHQERERDRVPTYETAGVDSAMLRYGSYEGVVSLRPRYLSDGTENERRSFKPDEVIERWGLKFVKTEDGLLHVRPKRERCKHYRRSVWANDDVAFKPGEFGHLVVYRNCEARRSVGGALMSVQDQSVYACEHRSPPDPASVKKYLDEPDYKRVHGKVEMVPLFNLPDSNE